MSHQLKKEYLKAIRERYLNSNRSKKTMILDEFCEVCNYSRKYAIAVLNGKVDPCIRKPRGRQTKYSPEIIYYLGQLWEQMNCPGSTKFHAAIPEWIEYVPEFKETSYLVIKTKLLEISRAQIDRVLKPYRERRNMGISSTRSATKRFLCQIPIQPKDWNITKPGQLMQADTVAHCGNSLSGTFANSLTITDIDSTWTENRALWGKSSARVIEAMKDIELKLPFKLQGFKSDSGSEFMNQELWVYFKENRPEVPVQMVRSRPYKKDDNCYVEQKNFTHVRELFGYERIDQQELVELMNEIYTSYWCPLQNFFIPTQKILRKIRIGARIKKEYEKAQTPYQRLMVSAYLSDEEKNALKEQKSKLNPFNLQKELQEKLKTFEELLRKRNTGLIAA